MRRIANVGFAIAALYFVYLIVILVNAARVNASFEGQALGPVQVESLPDGAKAELQSPLRRQVVVLWATWCGPCHALLLDLKGEVEAGRLQAADLVAVSIAEPRKDVEAYLEQWPLPFRVVLDREGHLAKRVQLQGTPTVMFLDQNGVIQNLVTGGFGLPGKIADFVARK